MNDFTMGHLVERVTRLETELAAVREDARKTREFVDKYDGLMETIIQREARRAQLAQAIIEKSVVGAFWALVVFVALATWEFVKNSVKGS